MAAPRVLLVDDDAMVRRWVEAALDGLDLQLVTCADVATARAALAEAPAALVICDLMLPGIPGMDWLAELAADDGLRRGARLVAFSAGVDGHVRARLQVLGVWRVLHKPLPLYELLACVQEALAQAPDVDDAAHRHGACATAGRHAEPPGPARPDADQDEAVRRHFGGDAALFRDYRASCIEQFPADLAGGDAAQAAGDLAALRRLGHSLKTVLRMLGLQAAAAQAAELDDAARRQDAVASARAWQALRATLAVLAGP